MHSLSKIAGVQSIAIALAMILSVFGTEGLKAQSCAPQSCAPVATCPTCQISCKDAAHARHEAAENQARAERAQKRAADKAARERAEADAAEQKGAERAAKYEARANKRLEDAGLLCPAPEVQSAEVSSEVPEKSCEPEAAVTPAPEPTPEPLPTVTPEPQEAPAAPTQLPKTASPMDLIGLIGLVSFTGGVSRKFFRR